MSMAPGRELWAFQPGGQLMHVASKKCAGVVNATAGTGVVALPCNRADVWELLANGQARVGSLCLSQQGSGAGMANAAAQAAATASSTADARSHGAAAAVDLDEATYWASKLDEPGPIDLSVDLGSARHLEMMRISWVFPAKAFAVSLSTDGEQWSEVFTTSTNAENSTVIALGGQRASKVRLVMKEAHPLFGVFRGHVLYGVRSISILAPRLDVVVDDCATAAKSHDARDKYFAAFVSEFDPAASQSLQGELPALTAARAALSAALVDVMSCIPKASTCREGSSSLTQAPGLPARRLMKQVWGPAASGLMQDVMASSSRGLGLDSDGVEAAMARAIDVEYGLGAPAMQQFLGSARSSIVALRGLLQ